MRARRHQRSGELAAHNFYRTAHLRESALARKQPRFAPSRSLVTFLSRCSVASLRTAHLPAGHDSPDDDGARSTFGAGIVIIIVFVVSVFGQQKADGVARVDLGVSHDVAASVDGDINHRELALAEQKAAGVCRP